MTQRFLLQASLPVLIVSSALAIGENDVVGECQNEPKNSRSVEGGTECACGRSVCVHDPKTTTKELPVVKVTRPSMDGATCLNYFETPMEPDWGCSPNEPLCVDTFGNRPVFGAAGAKCAPYPCHNTKPHPMATDQGCTPMFPTCVDGLENSPPPGKPGIRCIAYASSVVHNNKNDDGRTQTDAIPAWGVPDSRQFGSSEPMVSGCRKGNAENTGHGLNDGHFSLCNGCPFGGITGTCDVGKLAW